MFQVCAHPFTQIQFNYSPTMENANVTYTVQRGYYIKLGCLVFIWFRLRGTINSVSSPAYAFVSGLPFSAGMETAGSLFEHGNISDDSTRNVLLRVVAQSLAIQKDDSSEGVSIEYWNASNNTFYLGGSAVYFTND